MAVVDRSSGRKAATAICYFNGSFVSLTNGSHTRFSDSLKFLLNSFENVIIYSYRDHPTLPWTPEDCGKLKQLFPSVQLVLDESRKARVATRIKNAGLQIFPQIASPLLRFRMPSATPNYDALVRDLRGEGVWFITFADGLSQLNGLPGGTVIVDTHDVKFLNAGKKRNQRPTSLRALLRLRGEIAALDVSNAVLAISPTECGFFKTVLSEARVFYIPAFLPVTASQETDSRQEFLYDLLFVGALNQFNANGLIHFFKRWGSRLNETRICIAGKVCESEELQAVLRDRVNVTAIGYVQDLAELYQRSKACLAPTEGTGLKMKVVGAIAHGKPVFASQHAMDSLPPGYENCVFPLDARKILETIGDENSLAEASKAARKYAGTFESAGDVRALAEYLQLREPRS